MDKIRNYNIVFSGLKLGKHLYDFEISQEFFDLFTFDQDFRNPKINVQVTLEKHSTFLDLHFDLKGKVEVDCDVTDEAFDLPIEGQMPLVVKFGHELDDSDDEVWTIPFADYEINVAQLIYELALLSIPNKRVNPNLNSEEAKKALDLLEKYAPKSQEIEDDQVKDSNDPTWDKLKNLFKEE